MFLTFVQRLCGYWNRLHSFLCCFTSFNSLRIQCCVATACITSAFGTYPHRVLNSFQHISIVTICPLKMATAVCVEKLEKLNLRRG
jgi:hypothetical protein